MKRLIAFVAFMFAAFGAQGALAQSAYQPGDELRGHSVQIEANGDTNTVSFERDGTARIVSSNGAEATGRWYTEGQTLCLSLGPQSNECWPYRAAFRTGQAVSLTSTCAITSRWTPISTEPMAPPVQDRRGERG